MVRPLQAALDDIDTSVYLPRKRNRVPSVPLAVMLAALVWFNCSGLNCFKRFVHLLLPVHLSRWRLSYSRWCYWRAQLASLMEALAGAVCTKQGYRGVALVDSTTLPVCGIQRERDNKCFLGLASKGCGSLGWFFGFKLHVIASDNGELLRFWLSTGKTHDTAPLYRADFLRGLTGCLVGDSGYRVGKGKTSAKDAGLVLLARPVGVRNEDMPWPVRQLFQARWRIETLIGSLKDSFGLRASRACRTPATFKATVFGSLIAYTLARQL
jgi:hypothetical protein